MISCGEASGDMYAGALATELRRRAPEAEIFGFGGRRLQAAGGHLIGDYGPFAVTGLTEAVRVFPRSFAMLRRLIDAARELRPNAFVAIDFPDFNFKLMAAIRRLGIPIIYYISPQLWAWRPGRMDTMKAYVDRVLVIFPFEEALYQQAGVAVQFVGHPLVDMSHPGQERSAFLAERGLDPAAPTVALLPGSRRNELERIVPVVSAAVPIIRARVPNAQFVVACAPNLPDALFARLVNDQPDARLVLVRDRTDDVLAASDVVITASGTATIQCVLHERPMVVVYRVSPLTYRLGKPFIKVDTFAMPNLVAGRRIVPELIQDDFTPERTANEALALLTDPARHAAMRDALADVRQQLGPPGASGRAADAVLEVITTTSGMSL
ncbi:MAG TPA: lipid-A-disaccharide synthase [Vicinamibacterales bacterium]|nr:lipid-A-disaccharide synthase [Vicinamibacterales bacterium]